MVAVIIILVVAAYTAGVLTHKIVTDSLHKAEEKAKAQAESLRQAALTSIEKAL